MRFVNITKSLLLIILLTCEFSFAQNPANWQPLGPIQFPVNTSGQINGIGRVCQIKFHPSDPQKAYAVSASGGLWISTNATLTWQKTGTDQLPLTACSSVCIDFTNDSILYLSTGDPNYYSNGSGIYKSVDAGNNWILSNTGIGNRMAVELLIDPFDHNILVAASNDGIWKTTNGGMIWTVKKSGGQFTDMVKKPSPGSRTLYAVTFSEFYKSEDFGDTWTLVSNGISVPGGGSGQGMRLAVSAADTNIVYTGMIKDEGTIFKSTDGGNNFSTVYHNPTQSLVGYDANGNGQGNYNFCMAADPNNANKLFVAAHVVWRSSDGGISWTQLTQWAYGLHTDMHQMIYNPYATQELYNINDGGVWRSVNNGVNWVARSNGIAATEIYKAGHNPLRKDMISIGTQDNGELYTISNQWRTNRGGDWGSRMTYDYLNSNLIYYHENGKRRNILGGPEVTFGLPFIPSNSCRLTFTPLNTEMALAGESALYLSTDLSAPTPSWTQISNLNTSIKSIAFSGSNTDIGYVISTPDQFSKFTGLNNGNISIFQSTLPSGVSNGASVTGLPNDTNVIFVTAGSKVYRSSDQGLSWGDISYNLPNINILKIIHDPYSTDESVYVCNAAGIWYKNQNMSMWASYSQGLPFIANITDFMYYDDGPVNSVIRVATYGRGVWESSLQSNSTFLSESHTSAALLIIPNPASQKISFSAAHLQKNQIRKIIFYTSNGIQTASKEINSDNFNSEFDIREFDSGLYFILLFNHDGKRLAGGKFIKE